MINFSLEGQVALLTVDDGKANVVGHPFIDALNECLDRAEKDAKAVVLHGREGKFSAGFDLQELSKGTEATVALVSRAFPLFLRLFKHPQATIAACNGHAIGAGAFILFGCDTRIGADGQYKIRLPETAIGMNFPPILLELAKARLNKRFFTSAIIQARSFAPTQAIEAGFLDEVVDADKLLDHALAEAAALAELPADKYAKNKLDCRGDVIDRMQASLDAY